MRTYWQILKYNFKSKPQWNYGLVFLIIILTIYRSLDSWLTQDVFSSEVMAIVNTSFIMGFTIFSILVYANIFEFLQELLSVSIFHMVPKIRKKAIIYSSVYLFIMITWSLLVFGFERITALHLIVLLNIWFLSFCMSILLFGKLSVYKTNRYKILKVLFFLSAVVIPLVGTNKNEKYLLAEILFQVGFVFVIAYQVRNFVNYFIKYKARESESKYSIEYKVDYMQSWFESKNAKLFDIFIKKTRDHTNNAKYLGLFQVTLFRNYPKIWWIIIGFIPSYLLFESLNKHAIKSVAIGISLYFGGASILYARSIFRQKSKLDHLYVISKLKRCEFENTVLFAIIRTYTQRTLYMAPSILVSILISNKFYNLSATKLLALVCFFPCATFLSCIIAYIFWRKIIKNKDFDTIKKARVMRS